MTPPTPSEALADRIELYARVNKIAAANLQKTHCPRGHPYAGANLYITKDGHRDCRQCQRIRQKQYRADGKFRASGKRHYAVYSAKYPEREKIRRLVRSAVESGKITRPNNCEECGKPSKVQGHHKDYSKPLEVKWLCTMCHSKEHQ